MAKTRSQTGAITIKKEEEEEEDRKPTHILNGINNTTKKRDRITKREPSKNNNISLPSQQVKVEEDTDTKALLQSTSKSLKPSKTCNVSQEQVNQLINYVVNHGMSVTEASRMAKVSQCTGCTYYNLYKNDPDKKIPLVRYRNRHPFRFYTQEQIENLIKYIVDDKMAVPQASAKANMVYNSGYYHYKKYLAGSKLNTLITPLRHHYSQERKNKLIRYIIDGKMSVSQASKKANISKSSASIYYHQFLKNHSMEIPVSPYNKRFTQDEINEFIGYVVDNKMSLNAAAKKANMATTTGRRYYQQYLKDHNLGQPPKKYTQGQINKFIGYVVDDKMSLKAAAKKSNMATTTGHRYYLRYLNNQKRDVPIQRLRADSAPKNR